jgi:hypothetical protein
MAKAIRIVSLLVILSLVLLAVPFLPAHVAGAPLPSDVWVAPPPLGNDVSNPGTEAQPFATIQKGIDTVELGSGGTVHVAAGTYHENLLISEAVNLTGAGASATIIDGGCSNRVMRISSAPNTVNIITGFTIQNGCYWSNLWNPADEQVLYAGINLDFIKMVPRIFGIFWVGGGIYIGETHIVTLNDCIIKDNHTDEYGGGIYNEGQLTMNRCTVSGNSAALAGGGIYNTPTGMGNTGQMWLTDCTISENSVTESDGQGGGIWNSGTLTINKCCISGNHASKGSGIHTMPDATATLTNCTISGNSGNGAGGGIRNWGNMWCYSVTISENHCSVGGGFSNDGAPARMYFRNCIVSSNTATSAGNNGYDTNSGDGVESEGHNIDSENSCYFNDSTDQRNTNPLLGPLQDNGGPTFTHALLHGSPAIDAGSNTGAPATDQRGTPRPQGTFCDIGAYELTQGSVTTATGTGTASFSTLNGYITDLTALTESQLTCPPREDLDFPNGLFSFKVTDITPGSSATVVIILPSDMPTDTQYWKCINGQWVDCTSLLGSNDGDSVLTLTITDGGLGDLDGVANGEISDPGGPAIPAPPTVTTVSPNSGVQGQTLDVIITGVNFTGATAVSFGAGITVNRFTVYSATQITVNITIAGDATLGTRDVSVTTPGGTGTLTGGFTVNPAPASPNPRASPSMMQPPRLLSPAQLSAQYVSVSPQQTTAGQPVTITTNVVNTGGEAGNLDVALKINGQVEQSRMVSVGPQGIQSVAFTVNKAQPGTYNVDILGKSGSFTILGTGSSTPSSSGNSGLIVLLIIGMLVLVTVVVLILSRHPA